MTSGRVAAWGILLVVLTIGADIEPLSELAVAFAYLIMLAVLLSYGPAAFAWLSARVGATPATGATAGAGGPKPIAK